jgi:lysozyme family protein
MELLFAWISAREGGYVNHPSDSGRETNRGITLASFIDWRTRKGITPTSAVDLQRLTQQQFEQFYNDEYIRHPALRLDLLPPRIGAVILDGAILFSRSRAAKWAQSATGALSRVDGLLGPVSRAAMENTPYGLWLGRNQHFRVARHLARVKAEPGQEVFLQGWLNRTMRLAEAFDLEVKQEVMDFRPRERELRGRDVAVWKATHPGRVSWASGVETDD